MPRIDLNDANRKLLDAALWYAIEAGVPVFPLRPKDKQPLTPRGFKDASRDPHQIEEWWREHPDANLGMPTGEASGRLLLDLDFRGESIVRSRDDLREQFGEWPETAEVLTGAGRHLYFNFEPSFGSLPKAIAVGVELGGNGQYSVLPPSIHPSGAEYTFDGLNGRNSFLHVAKPPAWLVDAIAKARRRPQAQSDSEKWGQGQRNTQLTREAGRLRRIGLSPEAMEAALLVLNKERCQPPLSADEVKRIARSVGRYEPGPEWTVGVSPDDLPPTVDSLNRLSVFQKRIRFQSVIRRGPMIVAEFHDGQQAIWDSTLELMSFAKSQSIIASATDVVIPSPSLRKMRALWEPAAQMILRVAGTDKVVSEAEAADDFRELLPLVWAQAGKPTANTSAELAELLGQCSVVLRNPHSGPPPCAVWRAEGATWVHLPTLLSWLSTPVGRNRQYDRSAARKALWLLNFHYVKDIHRSAPGKSGKAAIWLGPLSLLGEE